MTKWFCFWLCALLVLGIVLVTYSDHELLSTTELRLRDEKIRKETTEQVNARMSYELNQREKCLRKEIRDELLVEQKESQYTLRNTCWGMTQTDVITTEGNDYIKRDNTTLIYKVRTAGLPSVIKYIFRGDKLVKSDLYFSNPKLTTLLPAQSHKKVEADFQRLLDMLTRKYGMPKRSSQVVSQAKTLSQKGNRLSDKLSSTQQEYNDLLRERVLKRIQLKKKYKGWKHADGRVQDQLKESNRQIKRLKESIKSIKKQQAAIKSQLREDQDQCRNGNLPKETVCHWCKSGQYDITLTRRSSSEGESLWARYNGYITPTLSAAPSDI